MKTQITATLIVCGALLASASSASAMELAGWQWWTAEGWQWAAAELDTTDLDTIRNQRRLYLTSEPIR